jgi:hypothetical protein
MLTELEYGQQPLLSLLRFDISILSICIIFVLLGLMACLINPGEEIVI